MRKLLSFLILGIMISTLSTLPGAVGAVEFPYVVAVEPGLTTFEVDGESFLVVTEAPLEIRFSGLDSERVHGTLIQSSNMDRNTVKFIWVQPGDDPITLYDNVMSSRSCIFDSEDVTGHNEKIF